MRNTARLAELLFKLNVKLRVQQISFPNIITKIKDMLYVGEILLCRTVRDRDLVNIRTARSRVCEKVSIYKTLCGC